MSSKKSVLKLMPAGVELRILPSMTSPLNGRKTTIRNSTVSSAQAINDTGFWVSYHLR